MAQAWPWVGARSKSAPAVLAEAAEPSVSAEPDWAPAERWRSPAVPWGKRRRGGSRGAAVMVGGPTVGGTGVARGSVGEGGSVGPAGLTT